MPERQPRFDAIATIEKRTRLPIFLLVASGYFLGVELPPAWPNPRWLVYKFGFWGFALPFFLLFYSGRDRLINLLHEVRNYKTVETTRADEWYERLMRALQWVYVGAVCGALGLAAGYFVNDAIGLNRYVSIAVGIFVFWGSLGVIASGEITGP